MNKPLRPTPAERRDIVIRCAFADLCGALQAFDQQDQYVHDWESHAQTLEDMIREFPELNLAIPENILHLVAYPSAPPTAKDITPMEEFTPAYLFRYNAVELHPVADWDGICEPISPADIGKFPDAAIYWSVYLHYDNTLPENEDFGGVQCVADFPTEALAEAYARNLEILLRAAVGTRFHGMNW